jgi:hypothetical protein
MSTTHKKREREREQKVRVLCGSFEEVFEVFHWFTGVS